MNEHPLATIMKLDPKLMDHLRAADELVYADGALPKKIKLLIALAFDAANGAVNGVRALARTARENGASDAEIAETVRVAYHLSGVGSVYSASQGLKEFLAADS